MEKVRVSVITIVRNDIENIANTMLSVLGQTYLGYEYIVKDGASTDGTQEVIQKVANKFTDKTVKVVSCSDTGIYDAMNQAVSYCEGEWIIFINCGDSFYRSNALEQIFSESENYQKKGILYGDAIVRDESGDAVWKADFGKVKKKMPFCHQSCFIRRVLLVQHPFNTKLRIAADYNNILELYEIKEEFYNLNKVIAIFKLDGISSTDFVRRYKERNAVLVAHGFGHKFSIAFPLGLFLNHIKRFIGQHVPNKMLVRLKKWYKKNVKKYEMINDENRRE